MYRKDYYRNFDELKAAEQECVDYCVTVLLRPNASTVVLAPHGGGIELGTSEVARIIAGNNLSLALFEGKKPTGNKKYLHITSTNFDEPRCKQLVQAANNVVTIHGEESGEVVVFLGGRNSALVAHIRTALEKHGFLVKIHKKLHLQGTDRANICNQGLRGAGVQLELAAGLRKTFFESVTAAGRKKPKKRLAKFAEAVREGLREGVAHQLTNR